MLLQLGTRLVVLSSEGVEVGSLRLPANGEDLGGLLAGKASEHLCTWGLKALGGPSSAPVAAVDPLSLNLLRSLGRPSRVPPPGALREARNRTFSPIPVSELIALGTSDLSIRLASREEQVMSLSRECDRLERLVRKDEELTSNLSLSSAPGTSVDRYLRDAGGAIAATEGRKEAAEKALIEEVAQLLPNTSRLLGPRTAARLLSESGSVQALSRLSASKIQLLGARRRSAGRSPRYGLIFLAEGMDAVPYARRGALGRTLASLATVALRADLLTHTDLSSSIIAKKQARIREICRARGR